MAFAFVHVTGVFLLIFASPLLSQGTNNSDLEDLEVCYTQVCQDSARFLLESMDHSVDPCNDFYRYACGGWIDKHPIPMGRRSYSTVDVLTDEVHNIVAEFLKNAINENHPKAIIDAARLYQGCIDEEARERQGVSPLRNILNSIGGWPMINTQWTNTSYEWYKQVAAVRRTVGVQAIVSVKVDEYPGKPGYVINLNEPSYAIDNDYLRNQTSDKAEKIIAAYRNFIKSTAKLLNPDVDESSLENDIDDIIAFMADLAAEPEPLPKEVTKLPWYQNVMSFIEFMITKAQAPSYGQQSKFTLSEIQTITQNEYFNWTDFLNDVFQHLQQVEDQTEVIVYDLAYLKHAIEVAENTDARTVANYIGWILIQDTGLYTTKQFREYKDRFTNFTKALEREEEEDEEENLSLEKTCVKQTAEFFDFAVGRLYVDKYISEEEMREIEQLVEDVRSAFEVNFNHNDWMDHTTKQKALEKLRYMVSFVGYPAWIKIDSELNDYYNLADDLREDAYFESFVKVKTAVEKIQLRKWNQRIHRSTEWTSGMQITDVNAMYDFSRNAMYLPAAIFNVPIYKRGTLPALNYAGFGSFIAHEITHGFDSIGHTFDKEGNQVDWWSPETKKKFDEKADCIKDQYSKIVEPMTNTSLKHETTLPDDIADNGAARNAFMAYEMQVLQAEEKQANKRNMRLPGLSATPEQLYFLGLATMECEHHTKESMKWTLENDAHSPAAYRVLLPLRNSRVFAEAFNCPLGSPMNPEKKCQLW